MRKIFKNIVRYFSYTYPNRDTVPYTEGVVYGDEATFSYNKYGREEQLSVGEKVQATYYHERIQKPRAIFPFTPVKCGVVKGSAGIREFYLGANGMELFLWVKFKEYPFAKAIPISCLTNTEVAAKRIKDLLNRHMDKIGQKGFSFEAYTNLSKQADTASKF